MAQLNVPVQSTLVDVKNTQLVLASFAFCCGLAGTVQASQARLVCTGVMWYALLWLQELGTNSSLHHTSSLAGVIWGMYAGCSY